MSVPFVPLRLDSILEALLAETGFVLSLAVGSLVLPRRLYAGAPGPDGLPRPYKLNGLLLFVLVVAAAAFCLWRDPGLMAAIPPRFGALLLAANILAFAASTFLLAIHPKPNAGHFPRLLADFFYGRATNPTWLDLDLKMFSHQPALIGLGIVNLSLAAWQFTLYGRLSVRMILYQLFVFLYVASYFQFESGVLFTRDVVSEKLGWMLVWGDYVVVPFFYSLPAWYLVDNHDPISAPALAASTLLFLGGFSLCRGANWQKHRFKQDPHARIWGAPAESVGGRLLVSGFWGIGRKLNYTGELATYCGWTLLCGFHSLVPYLVPLFLAGLLVHRSLRDERRCRFKYGKLWDEYCAHARFRMIPFIF